MTTIIHRIRLRPGTAPETFERWVREQDYAACPRLPSLAAFAVHRVSTEPSAPFHYVEVITVDSAAAFERDMATDVFGELVRGFSRLAEVVDEVAGDVIAPGYRRA